MDTVPSYQVFYGPVLDVASKASEAMVRPFIIEAAAELLKLSDQARSEKIASGLPRYISNCGWACTYLKQAGCLETPRRSFMQITARGLELFQQHGYAIRNEHLERFPEFEEFKGRRGTRSRGE